GWRWPLGGRAGRVRTSPPACAPCRAQGAPFDAENADVCRFCFAATESCVRFPVNRNAWNQ
ncbi:hypothetical protein ABTF71_19435, partial [Acinetobacter baumannii]